ncbi:hypothetical protein BDW22DRAFT_1352293 [Trametopsis cervina]|nr:hypothetical protein BDW22DRAFT_1352293 [Trametopsis cervina]
MDASLLEQFAAARSGSGIGRPVRELIATDGPLKGAESQRFRSWFTSECMEPSRDLDDYGQMLFTGDLAGVKRECARRVAVLVKTGLSEDEAITKAGQAQAELRWGPTRVPIFDLLLLARHIEPLGRQEVLSVVQYLINEAKVPVGSKDLSGSMAISHAISTMPSFDPELAQVLYDAGEDVNGRNRYGCTPAHEICMVRPGEDRSLDALEWYISHGGNLDVKDNDGMTPRAILNRMQAAYRIYPGPNSATTMSKAVAKEDQRRARLKGKCCAFCGREAEHLMACSRCKATYCSPTPGKSCQKADWPFHKTECGKVGK